MILLQAVIQGPQLLPSVDLLSPRVHSKSEARQIKVKGHGGQYRRINGPSLEMEAIISTHIILSHTQLQRRLSVQERGMDFVGGQYL